MMRYSRQREAILTVLQGTDTHPTADWVHQQVRGEIPNISLGTVYRNLTRLEGMGQIRRLKEEGQSRFDANLTPHDHFRCLRCNNIFDIHLSLDHMTDSLSSDLPFKITGMNLELLGECDECHNKEMKGNYRNVNQQG